MHRGEQPALEVDRISKDVETLLKDGSNTMLAASAYVSTVQKGNTTQLDCYCMH